MNPLIDAVQSWRKDLHFLARLTGHAYRIAGPNTLFREGLHETLQAQTNLRLAGSWLHGYAGFLASKYNEPLQDATESDPFPDGGFVQIANFIIRECRGLLLAMDDMPVEAYTSDAKQLASVERTRVLITEALFLLTLAYQDVRKAPDDGDSEI